MVTGVSTMSANALCSQVPTLKDVPVKSDRRSNKPIMEKRRRARINNCLNELKTLILDATKKDPSRHSKLEKADILEKTVKHLQELQRQQAALQKASDPKIINKFRAGFTDCANEVSQFPGLDTAVKQRLLQHLSNCINGMKAELHYNQRQMSATAAAQPPQQLHSQMLPSPPSSPEQDQQHQHLNAEQRSTNDRMGLSIQHTVNGYFLPNGLQVIPTKLSNGSIALVLPQSLPQHPQPAPKSQTFMPNTQQQTVAMMMQTPSRTASTGSASSQSSSSVGYERVVCSPSSSSMHYAPPSPANSYEAMDCKPSVIQHANMHHQQLQRALTPTLQQQQQQQQQQQNPEPLSLVIKKNIDIKEEEQPWRPW